MRSLLLILGCLLVISACRDPQFPVVEPDPPLPPKEKKGILFLGHIYEKYNTIAPRLEPIDFNRFSQIWLGGDICAETTKEKEIVTYLDDLFDLGAATTHWAVGNHDVRNGNLEWITEATGRGLYYTHHENGLTLLIINTNIQRQECEELEAQYALFRQVCDTITESSHLIIMTHHVIWGEIERAVNGANDAANGLLSTFRSRCQDSLGSQFHRLWYPDLVKVQERGVQVICLAGDFGQKASAYEYETVHGIWFLGNGLNKGIINNHRDPNDMVLFFKHDPALRSLIWQFVKVDLLGELLGE